jgi:hypothetical protein
MLFFRKPGLRALHPCTRSSSPRAQCPSIAIQTRQFGGPLREPQTQSRSSTHKRPEQSDILQIRRLPSRFRPLPRHLDWHPETPGGYTPRAYRSTGPKRTARLSGPRLRGTPANNQRHRQVGNHMDIHLDETAVQPPPPGRLPDFPDLRPSSTRLPTVPRPLAPGPFRHPSFQVRQPRITSPNPEASAEVIPKCLPAPAPPSTPNFSKPASALPEQGDRTPVTGETAS